MKYTTRTTLLIFLITIFLFFSKAAFGKEVELRYSQKDIYNYFSGIVSLNQDFTTRGFNHLNKVQYLKDIHSNYNLQFIRTLILLEKFEQAFSFSKSIWTENDEVFEVDLLLGIESFINKDYLSAEKYFVRLNKISKHNLIFDDFFGNLLISWVKASENKQKDSFKFFNKIPERFKSIKKVQSIFLNCYFKNPNTKSIYENLVFSEKNDYSRYNFFLANYLIYNNEKKEAEKIIIKSRKVNNSNLLIKQAENFIQTGKIKNIKNFYDCSDPRDSIAEIFYIIANMYSTQENYMLSNFYLRISLFLNNKFTPNKALLAENFLLQKQFENSKKIYKSVKLIGAIYSWHASTSLAMILSNKSGKKSAVEYLEKEFASLSNPNFEHYYGLANFFKDNEYYEKSVKYYSLALKKIDQKNNKLVSKILDRRGTSYERMGDWSKAEMDLMESLKILPDQPHVLNYLAYSWIEKGVNFDKALEMLKRATKLRKNDGYILDSLGWAYFAKKNYVNAEKFLQQAVKLLPLDPIINDHYADALWMLNKNIQARYLWKQVLSMNNVEKELKEKIGKKLIYGITKKL